MIRNVLIGIALLLLAASLSAENFVSFNGKFYITYPDTWKQIDYLTVDAFLGQAGTRTRTLQYEGVFAPENASPWYGDTYCILTVDTIPGITSRQIDSILLGFEEAFEHPTQERPFTSLLNNLTYGQLFWDPVTRTAAVMTEKAKQQGEKNTLLVMRFFDRGIANFYFYTTDSSLSSSLPLLHSVVASFSTENIESAMPRESAKIADPKKLVDSKASNKSFPIWAPTSGAVVIILIIALTARRRRQRRQAE